MIVQQAEKLLTDNEYEASSAQIMQLVNTSNCSAYGCEFFALAQYLNASLITEGKNILKQFPDVAKSLHDYFT